MDVAWMVVVVNIYKKMNGGYTFAKNPSHAQLELLNTHMRYISNASSPFLSTIHVSHYRGHSSFYSIKGDIKNKSVAQSHQRRERRKAHPSNLTIVQGKRKKAR